MDYPIQEIKIPDNEPERYRECDVCGFRYPFSMLFKNQGRWVCSADDDLPNKSPYRQGGATLRES